MRLEPDAAKGGADLVSLWVCRRPSKGTWADGWRRNRPVLERRRRWMRAPSMAWKVLHAQALLICRHRARPPAPRLLRHFGTNRVRGTSRPAYHVPWALRFTTFPNVLNGTRLRVLGVGDLHCDRAAQAQGGRRVRAIWFCTLCHGRHQS